jgi:hypothetical protein
METIPERFSLCKVLLDRENPCKMHHNQNIFLNWIWISTGNGSPMECSPQHQNPHIGNSFQFEPEKLSTGLTINPCSLLQRLAVLRGPFAYETIGISYRCWILAPLGHKVLKNKGLLKVQDNAEPAVVEPEVRAAAEAARHTTVGGEGVPAAAAKNTISTCSRPSWVCLWAGTVTSIPVMAPLPYIACHII